MGEEAFPPQQVLLQQVRGVGVEALLAQPVRGPD
jgi:hypothetical protein